MCHECSHKCQDELLDLREEIRKLKIENRALKDKLADRGRELNSLRRDDGYELIDFGDDGR